MVIIIIYSYYCSVDIKLKKLLFWCFKTETVKEVIIQEIGVGMIPIVHVVHISIEYQDSCNEIIYVIKHNHVNFDI